MPGLRVDRAMAVLLAVALATFGLVKIGFGYRQGLEISRTTYYAASAVELLAATMLLTRLRLFGALLTAIFFAVAIAYSQWSGVHACGCLGPVRLTSTAYRLIAATLGLTAVLLVQRRLYRP
ncbi:MAG: hypothetical protein R3F56_23965 [Planctomycetota bacterium]